MVKRVLVCDDDEAISEMLKIMLKSAGFDVKLISSGRAIQKRVKEYSPHIILIDIWMPGIDGREAIKLIKKNQLSKSIPIIIISALHEYEIGQMVKEVGADGFLAKPFNMRDLLNIVEKYTI